VPMKVFLSSQPLELSLQPIKKIFESYEMNYGKRKFR
jgi:hypothetical protein